MVRAVLKSLCHFFSFRLKQQLPVQSRITRAITLVEAFYLYFWNTIMTASVISKFISTDQTIFPCDKIVLSPFKRSITYVCPSFVPWARVSFTSVNNAEEISTSPTPTNIFEKLHFGACACV